MITCRTQWAVLKTDSESDDSYALKVDEQVSKFLELSHKLTFFLVTAAVGTLGFTLNTAIDHGAITMAGWGTFSVLTVAAILALTSAAMSLAALRHDSVSFQLHLRYRYARTEWDDLSQAERDAWNDINQKASWCRKHAFRFLLVTVTLQVVFFLSVFGGQTLVVKEEAMHHFGESSTTVSKTDYGFHITFRNKETNQVISMNLPRTGVLEMGGEITEEKARAVADQIAHLLRENLVE